MGPTGVLLGTGLSFMPFLIQIYSGFKNQSIDFKLLKTNHFHHYMIANI